MLFFPSKTIDLTLIARDFTAIRGLGHAFRQACIFGSFILRGRVQMRIGWSAVSIRRAGSKKFSSLHVDLRRSRTSLGQEHAST
jgi:hypothetical protein